LNNVFLQPKHTKQNIRLYFNANLPNCDHDCFAFSFGDTIYLQIKFVFIRGIAACTGKQKAAVVCASGGGRGRVAGASLAR
jgi:hypothetical protein